MLQIRLVFMILIAAAAPLLAQEAEPTTSPADAPQSSRGMRGRGGAAPTSQPADEQPVTTDHEVEIDGNTIKYKATAGQIPLKDDAGKVRGRVFFIAYEKAREAGDAAGDRPVTFVFNGGPGAASVWLHLGTAGPQRVVLPEDGRPPAPPYRMAANPQSWLDLTDLVFIDPVGTGYSRPETERGREFYGVEGDVASVADFIRLYLTRYQRWASPKFLAGESYGTTRAAGLSEYLHDRYGIDLNGIVLISTVLNFQTLNPSAGNDLPYPLFLPTYTACAWHHKKLPPQLQDDLQKATDEARQWAMGDYMSALMKGASLAPDQRRQIAEKLAMYSGLPVETIERANLKLSPGRFEKFLLSDQGQVIGRMDGRISGYDADPLSDRPDFDPSLTGYVGLFSSNFNQYVRSELKYENEDVYEFLSSRTGQWDFGPAGRGYLNVATTLRECMTKVPSMKVMLASGYYDLATPFAAADYTVDQMPLSDELRRNITHNYYEGGHMMYLAEPALVKLKKDLRAFYESALQR